MSEEKKGPKIALTRNRHIKMTEDKKNRLKEYQKTHQVENK